MPSNEETMMERRSAHGAFLKTAARLRGRTCALVKRGGRYRGVRWEEVAGRVLALAAGLAKRGLARGDRVAIMVTTRLEWTIADLAIMAAGGISVPVYCALTTDRIAHILADAGPKMAIVEDERVANLFEEARRLGGIEWQLLLVGIEEGAEPLSIHDIEAGATPSEIEEARRRAAEIGPCDVATYVYTSGTTGALKGVVITHGMILSEIESAGRAFRFKPNQVGLLALPLAHVLGRMIQFYHMIHGPVLAYAESLDKLAENYLEVRPHFVCGVPRMLEKIYEKVWEHVGSSGRRSRRMAHWALRVGRDHGQLMQQSKPIPLKLAVDNFVADLMVFRKLRARLGGRLRTFICGGSRLSEDVTRFFFAAGMKVLEGYGLTETFAAVTVNRSDEYRFGTVGKLVDGVSLKLAPDREILIKGPMVFAEYLNLPKETAAAFDGEGWFRSGDLGEYSRDGFLRITGRKKEMIVTSGGKNIAPQMIEGVILRSSLITSAMVYGDGRKYLTALIVVDRAEVARRLGRDGADGAEVRRLVEKHIASCNGMLASYETIKRFAIVDADFSVAGGELTPTMKVRRQFTAEKYSELLEELYRG